AGELPADTDAETVRSMVYGGIEHRMWALLYGRGTIDVEATADRYTAMLLHGILAPADEAAAPISSKVAALSKASAQAPGLPRDEIERRLARLEEIVATQLVPTAAKRRKDAP
ncbi:MAG: hypothetical protein JWP52_467, partial [Rhizobacter sp.]|nr:hypothetical protein [Rhizobacter sp.]